jgi:BON domain
MLMPMICTMLPIVGPLDVASDEMGVDTIHVGSNASLKDTAVVDLPHDASGADLEKQSIFESALASNRIGELRRVRVGVDDANVTLQGTVSSFYLKQLAQESIRPFALGLTIRNELRVA